MLGLGAGLTSDAAFESLYSIELDGTGDYIDIGNVLNLGTADFTISLWAKADDLTNMRFISKYENDNNQVVIKTQAADKLFVKINDGGTAVINFTAGTAFGSGLRNTWIHICLTADRDGNGVAYVNGATTLGKAAFDISSNSSVNLTNTGNWRLGRHGSGYMTGKLDEVAIWNVALDSDAVAAIYNSGSPIDLRYDSGNYDNSDALQGYWKLNDSSGTIATDSAGSNDGTLSGDAIFNVDTPNSNI